MRNETNGVLNRLVKEGIDTAQGAIHDLEKDANKAIKDANKAIKGVRTKGKAAQAQVSEFFTKMEPAELIESAHKAEKQWTKKASKFGANLLKRVGNLQGQLLKVAGIATRADLEAIASDIEKITRKIDRLVRDQSKRPAAPRAPKALKPGPSDA